MCFTIALTPVLTLLQTFSVGSFDFNFAGIWYVSLSLAVWPSMLRGFKRTARNPNFKWVILLMLYSLALIPHSEALTHAIHYWIHLFVDLSFYLLIPGLLTSKKDISKVVRWIGLSGIVPGIIAIYGFVFSTRILELPPELQSAGVFRVNGTFPNTSDLAIYMALIIPTQVFPVITRMRKTTAIRMDAMFLYFACAISVVSLILTFTRAPFLVLLLTLGLLMAFQSTTSKVKTIFLGLMLASLVAVLIPYSASEMARVGENTVASRLINWHLAFSNISSGSLFIGRGLESFRSISFGGQVHNDYLKLLLETGIIGLSLYLMVIFKELVPQLKLFFRLRKDVSDADFVISSSLVACFIEYILLSAFDPLFCAGPFATIFWILAGCSRAFVNQCPKNKVK